MTIQTSKTANLRATKLNKSALSKGLAETHGLTTREADEMVDTFLSILSNAIVDGVPVVLKGVGTITTENRPEHVRHGFGEAHQVPAKRVPKFAPSEVLTSKIADRDTGAGDMAAILSHFLGLSEKK
jgi:nucleoid DNA-binding protein